MARKRTERQLDSPGNGGGKRRVGRAGGGEPASWKSVNPMILLNALEAVASNGGALRLGYTRDGGAYAIGVYGDGDEPYTDYIRPNENIDEYFIVLAELWQ